jgi:hypothetical protein
MYKLTFTREFIEKVEKRTRKDSHFNKKVKKASQLPLKTHKANVISILH